MVPFAKITSVAYAADLMRAGRSLMQMHTGNGVAWFIVPGGEVTEKVATALLERADVQPNADGLFPNISQTYKMRSARQ